MGVHAVQKVEHSKGLKCSNFVNENVSTENRKFVQSTQNAPLENLLQCHSRLFPFLETFVHMQYFAQA